MKRVPRPRIIKTHEYFDPRFKKVLYLVRDPRDVAVSLYNFRRKYRVIDDSYSIERYVSERFIYGDLDLSWGEHVGSWLGARGTDQSFLLVRYEDLEKDVAKSLANIAQFFGINSTHTNIATAIERSSANRLRKLEKVEHEKWVTTKGKRADIPFIATAKSGNWKEVLSRSAATHIESKWAPLMSRLGYELESAAAGGTSR
jgi:hypothetical protein